VNSLSQTMTVGAGDVDPSDGQVHIRFVFAPVLESVIGGHQANQESYYFVQVTNVTKSTVLYTDFANDNEAGLSWQTVTGPGSAGAGTSTYFYTDWQLVDVAPGAAGVTLGDQVKLEIIASGCALGAHMGELYVDGVGAAISELYV